jgi:hypothetical protein
MPEAEIPCWKVVLVMEVGVSPREAEVGDISIVYEYRLRQATTVKEEIRYHVWIGSIIEGRISGISAIIRWNSSRRPSISSSDQQID